MKKQRCNDCMSVFDDDLQACPTCGRDDCLMELGGLTAEERCKLAARTAAWCDDMTESWGPDNIGLGLAYLLWSIVDLEDCAPFDSTWAASGNIYDVLIDILKQEPDGLFDVLVNGGFILT